MPTAGELRHRINIEEVSSSFDATGTKTDTWSVVATRWGSIREDADDKFTIVFRYYPGLVPTALRTVDSDGNELTRNRLEHQGRILNIESAQSFPGAKKVWHRLTCIYDREIF